MNSPQTIQREDGTWQTGDVFFDELEDALARGESLEHVISRLNTT
jgi:predicted RNase H-like HicB family nuclease